MGTYSYRCGITINAHGSDEFEADDDFAALMKARDDANDNAHDIDWDAVDVRISDLCEVMQDGSERPIVEFLYVDEKDRDFWRRTNAAEAMLAAIKRAMPFIDAEIEQRKCGGNDEDWAELQSVYEQMSDAVKAAEPN